MSMKKSIFLLAAAAAAFASCTQSEVMEVAENRAIGFNAFVNNNTRAVTEFIGSKTSGDIYVIGYYGADNASMTTSVFANELGNVEYYWLDNQYYIFGAYADGQAGEISNATFSSTDKKLTFASYTPDDSKDLVAAVSDVVGPVTASTQGKVSLTFSHMLAQVGFTFNTEVGTEYTLNISNIKINKAIKTAEGTYIKNGSPAIAWSGTAETGEAYAYEDITDLANKKNKQSQQFKLVIPQPVPTTSGSEINVTFDASISGAGINETRQNISVNLTSPDTEGWKPGYRYNYTATINGDDIQNNLYPIEFTVESIPEWQKATMGNNGNLNIP